MGKTIGILSLKGGVGKTSSVVALGAAIAGFGKRVLLVDGNFSSPCLGLHLNIIDPEVSIHHVFNILKAVSELRPYTEYKPKSEGSIEYKKLAATLIGEKYKPLGLMDLIRKLNLKKQDVNREIFYQRVFK